LLHLYLAFYQGVLQGSQVLNITEFRDMFIIHRHHHQWINADGLVDWLSTNWTLTEYETVHLTRRNNGFTNEIVTRHCLLNNWLSELSGRTRTGMLLSSLSATIHSYKHVGS